MTRKHLNARGKGEYSYDYSNDILFFKTKDRDYAKSLDFGNLIADIDTRGFITGLRIFDASKILKIPRISLRNLRNPEFNIEVDGKIITFKLRFSCEIKNKEVMIGQDFVRESMNEHIQNSEVICTV